MSTSCKECHEAPSESYFRWQNTRIAIRGCEFHVKQVVEAVAVVQAFPELPHDPLEVEKQLRSMDWNSVLPVDTHLKPFLEMCTTLGGLSALYIQLKRILDEEQEPVA